MWIDATQVIKDRLKMTDVVERYGFSASRRMRCPLHNGDGLNFEIKDSTWRCYSRCGCGDAISFVQKLFGVSFQEALRKIDADFGLGIYGNHSFEELRRSHYQQQSLRAKREAEAREKQMAEDEYWAAFDEWKRLDDNVRRYRPVSPDETPHPLFLEGLQKLSYQRYVLDCLDERRMSK
jgi:DNA primase